MHNDEAKRVGIQEVREGDTVAMNSVVMVVVMPGVRSRSI